MRKILVTGGAGFIGSHLVENLRSDSNKSVYVADNLASGSKSNLSNSVDQFHEIDLTDINEVSRMFENVSFDHIYHMAALSNVRSDGVGTEQFRHNTEITRNIVHCATKFGEPDISFASSSVVYGETSDIPTKEDHKTQTTSYYGSGKVASESLLNTYSSQTQGSIKILRMANIVGPKLRNAVIPDFIEKLDENENELEILGNGSQTKSYMYVDDCVSAIIGISKRDGDLTVNIGTDSTTSVTDIADIVSDVLDVSPEYNYTGGDKGWEGDVPEMMLDVSKMRRLGYEQHYSSDEAVRKATEELADEIL